MMWVYVVLCIIPLYPRFGGLSSPSVVFSGVGRKCDGCSFSRVLGELPHCFGCISDLDVAHRMLSGTTWSLRLMSYLSHWGGWSRE